MKVWSVLALAVLGCLVTANLAADTTTWTVDGRYAMLNGEVFLFKGVNYSPLPIGASQVDDAVHRGDVFTSDWDFLYQRDLPAMRAMGTNSLRVYNMYPWTYPASTAPNWTQSLDLDHTEFLDACWNDGDNPIYVWITYHMGTSFHVATGSPPDTRPTWRLTTGDVAFLDPSWDASDSLSQELARNAFLSLAEKYGTHPAVSGFFISNEQNNDQVRGSWQFWKWFDTTAQLVKKLAPTKLTGMTIVDDAMLSVQNAESFELLHLDVWGINSYRGTDTTGFDSLFSSYAAASNRPLIIGEFGPPASTRDSSGNIVQMPNNAKLQADYLQVHWEDIMDNRDVCCGGLVFEWTDEWWKHENPSSHDATPAANAAYPGGWGDEEWFGLNAVAMISSSSSASAYASRGADVLTPRAAVKSLTALWTATTPPAPPQAPPSPITLVPYAPLGPLAPVQVPQNNPTAPIVPTVPSTKTPSTAPSAPSAPSTKPSSAPSNNQQSSGASEVAHAAFFFVAAMAALIFCLV